MNVCELANPYLRVTFNRAFHDSELSKDTERGYGDPNYNVGLTMSQKNGNGKWVSVHGQIHNE